MTVNTLQDVSARHLALTKRDGTVLVEAGAGSGKTAIIAGRIALMLAEGYTPASIAAVSFTEVSASELMARVREFVERLLDGDVPVELQLALPNGLLDEDMENLQEAHARLEEIVCTTIHGFCQQLIKPYPVEAGIDPGADVMDANAAALVFGEVLDGWLRTHLDRELQDDIVAEMVARKPSETLSLITTIAHALRQHRSIVHEGTIAPPAAVAALADAIVEFRSFVDNCGMDEQQTEAILAALDELLPALDSATFDARGLVELLVLTPSDVLVTGTGSFRKYQKKGKWETAAKEAGLHKSEGEAAFLSCLGHYEGVAALWSATMESVASAVLTAMVDAVGPVLDRYQEHKRRSALLDFEDLIFAARDLLRKHPEVRDALSRRHRHLLVDEFQDTDPLQAEIFWRLAALDDDGGPWADLPLSHGALFLVGDPKQAIYRFRGADVNAYIAARKAIVDRDPHGLIRITTNFRSCGAVLDYVNTTFEPVLSEANGQPGFTRLDRFHADVPGPCVAAIDIAVADENGKATATEKRDAEAERVADLVAVLIGNRQIRDKDGAMRACRPGDIALLAPTGTDLWRYEEALERRGVPVATQAGKGFFRRQEIQDVLSLTRVLSNHRDTLALGALLRGPLVGATDEQLLDVVWNLPRDPARPKALPRLDINVDPADVSDPLIAEVLAVLRSLRSVAHDTTPHAVLARAVDELGIRSILAQRHHGHAERALSNLDLYLELSRAYSGRGLRAFAEAMNAAWNDEERSVEAKPDSQIHAVSLVTMHASKGLEWPVVIPVNTATTASTQDSVVVDRIDNGFYAKVAGVKPCGFDQCRDAEKAEVERERARLWYVAATRARELLVLPRFDVDAGKSWIGIVELGIQDLEGYDLAAAGPIMLGLPPAAANLQTDAVFAEESARIAAATRRIVVGSPSRHEDKASMLDADEEVDVWFPDPDAPIAPDVRGSRERGLVMHKLFEEALTGETRDDTASLASRAADLIEQLGMLSHEDASTGISADEIAACVVRSLNLPQIVVVRDRLVPEVNVLGLDELDGIDCLTVGIADAVAFDGDDVDLVVDWKSDVDPSPETLDHYRDQVEQYLKATGAESGLIVLATAGRAIRVDAPSALYPSPSL